MTENNAPAIPANNNRLLVGNSVSELAASRITAVVTQRHSMFDTGKKAVSISSQAPTWNALFDTE